jgi:isopenicillin-N N-acyltransferase like protein
MRKRIVKILGYTIGSLVILVFILWLYLMMVATVTPPKPADTSYLSWIREKLDSTRFLVNNNWLRKSESGLFEMYVEGNPFERGVAIGKLTKELANYQEEVFVNQLYQIVPSKAKINFLKYFVGWFNRNLEENIPEEFKLEIYGISLEAPHEYDFIAPAYHRMLNYHAAHDIGHALQNMSLVGCTSFAAWDDRTDDGGLVVGRNFDFYVGDDFAKNKIIAFYNPSQGHKFMMVTFGGMTGALSGMNDQGLTVTINAAKSDIPSATAMPVSLVAREILQYAGNIEEALAIATKRKMFVAESFLIGSAMDKRAAIIEKTPEQTDLYEEQDGLLICTNHFQGKTLGETEINREHIRTSASLYRWERVAELLGDSGKISFTSAADLLRDQLGKGDSNIGMGNEKTVNQLIAHHSIIFKPEELKVWISTAPYQLGKYVCYDLNKIFALTAIPEKEIYDSTLTIEPDPFRQTKVYRDFKKFAKYRFPFQPRTDMQPDSLVKWNPDSYLAYMLAGDATFSKNEFARAKQFYETGLTKEVATLQERDYMNAQLEKCKSKLE